MAGAFITVEGAEGGGKTTNVLYIARHLEAAGHTVVRTREPGGTPLAEDVRDMLLAVREETVAPLAELLLMFAARAQHINEVIRPALARGDWVLCDRFTDATYAYQGGGRGVDTNQIATLAELVHGDLQPDLTLYLDVPVDVSFERIAGRPHDRFEREQRGFYERVRNAYLARAESHARYRTVDASQPLESVQAAIKDTLDGFVSAWPHRDDRRG